MGSVKHTTEKAIQMMRTLPRVSLGNIRDNPNSKQNVSVGLLRLLLLNAILFLFVPQDKRGRAQHGGDKHGAGNKGSGQRQNFLRVGYETGNNPFYLRFPYEPYYKGHQ